MLSPGDKITIHVRRAMESGTFRATIEKFLGCNAQNTSCYRWHTDWTDGEVFTDDEGTKWIRGWHEDNSTEVLALLAAAALVNAGPVPFIPLFVVDYDHKEVK
jgi:hypothetical protein